MKRILFIAAIFCSSLMVLQSCSTTKSGSGSASLKRGNVSGTWVLNNVTFEGIPAIAVKNLFGEASYKCFIGSTWNLTNSGNGSYTLLGGNECAAGTQSIFWSVSTGDETFQFKKLYEGDKAKNVDTGYRLVLSSASGDNLILKSPIEYGSSTAYVVLNYSKATK
ncbi:hypothetical protein [Pedobacter sp.]|uniref:hypothetical protein n=1 Tax=Pedobacter sp. TaxID=1411316 RepID=UPI003D7FED52